MPDFKAGFGHYECARCGYRWERFDEAFDAHIAGKLAGGITGGIAVWILAMIIFATSCQGAITPSFLSKVEALESGGRADAVGDRGKSIGSMQIQFATWLDVSEFRASKGLKTYSYKMATNREIARVYAADYFKILELQLVAATGRKPSKHLLYACYALGFKGLQRRDFSISKLPPSTRKALARL